MDIFLLEEYTCIARVNAWEGKSMDKIGYHLEGIQFLLHFKDSGRLDCIYYHWNNCFFFLWGDEGSWSELVYYQKYYGFFLEILKFFFPNILFCKVEVGSEE